MMLTIGLTGGIGSGKTVAANAFSKLGVPVIDTDIIAHQLTEPNTPVLAKIIQTFGSEYLTDKNELNRTLLAKHIFSDVNNKKMLEDILHPAIKTVVLSKLKQFSKAPYTIIVVPLLFETSFINLVDRSLVIDSSVSKQIERTKKRDGKSDYDIRSIISTQLNRDQRLEKADDVLNNFGTITELNAAVKALHQQYNSHHNA